MTTRQRQHLKIVDLPPGRKYVRAPPTLIASSHTIDYCCGNCGAVLLHADDGQVHNLIIHCTWCEAFNSTEL
jgi:hypothetical protein